MGAGVGFLGGKGTDVVVVDVFCGGGGFFFFMYYSFFLFFFSSFITS